VKILLLGANGQVGWELRRSLATLGEVIALVRDPKRNLDGLCGDLEDPTGVAATVRAVKPDAVVNAAAYTAVDKAESDAERAAVVNSDAPAALADAVVATGAMLVHYSTDYVFDGSGTSPWRESDTTGPLNVYGATKLAGEQAIQASGCRHLIFRTSWVYAARGSNFAKTMLRLAAERDSLAVIADQFGAPTGAELIADVSAHCLLRAQADPTVDGLYHLAAAGETCWNGYARHVVGYAHGRGVALRAGPDSLDPIATSDYPTPATRPLNSRLDTGTLRTAFRLTLPDWRDGVDRMLAEHLATA